MSVFEAINGFPLGSITTDESKFLSACLVFPQFFEFLTTMGLNYGLIHNDLHLGNIFYDITANKLKLIDYGRMHIAAYDETNKAAALKNTFLKMIEKNLSDYAVKPSLSIYGAFLQRKNPYLKGRKHSVKPTHIYTTCIFDVITLCVNMAEALGPKIINSFRFIKVEENTTTPTFRLNSWATHESIFNEYVTYVQSCKEEQAFLKPIAEDSRACKHVDKPHDQSHRLP